MRRHFLCAACGIFALGVSALGQNYPDRNPQDRNYPDRTSQDPNYPDRNSQDRNYQDRDYPNNSNYNYPETIAAGTRIEVRTNQSIHRSGTATGDLYNGTVNRDVMDEQGHVAIPRGAQADLVVRDLGNGELAVDLQSLRVNGRRYEVAARPRDVNGQEAAGVGKNERTAKYVGGGALLGTIIGAIAGGGKGAAVGAIAGGAGGAGAQTLTRGHEISVPAESLLTFRLERPLQIGYNQERDRQRYRDDRDQRQYDQQRDQRPYDQRQHDPDSEGR